jgi:hypothetical protein
MNPKTVPIRIESAYALVYTLVKHGKAPHYCYQQYRETAIAYGSETAEQMNHEELLQDALGAIESYIWNN